MVITCDRRPTKGLAAANKAVAIPTLTAAPGLTTAEYIDNPRSKPRPRSR
jgi:hypothetical protein